MTNSSPSRSRSSLVEQLRILSESDVNTIGFPGQARQLMKWAADTIEAANSALSETAPKFQERAPQDVTDVRCLEWLFSELNDDEIIRKVKLAGDVHASGAIHGIRVSDWRHSLQVAMQQDAGAK